MKLFRSKNNSLSLSISRQEALGCVPVKNNSIECSSQEDGTILLEYPLPMSPFFRALYDRFLNNNSFPTKKLQLDEMGSTVWNSINGEDSAKIIISFFARKYGITLQESEESITKYLVELGKRGLIGLR